MRPRGEIREALRGWMPCPASSDGAAAVQPATWRDALAWLAARGLVSLEAPAELRLVRKTIENMRQGAELVPVGYLRAQGSRRPLVAFVRACGGPAQAAPRTLDACWFGRPALADAMAKEQAAP